MKTTTSKPAETKRAVKEVVGKKSATETKAAPSINEASVTIISEEKVSAKPVTATPATVPTTIKPEIDHNLIAQTAYFLWTTEGYQHGLHEEYWLRAEASLQPRK